MPRRPYVQFYFSDWLGDTKLRRLSLEQRAVHFELLCHAWDAEDGTVPADLGERALMLGVTTQKLKSLWPKLEPLWISDGNGGLVNPRVVRDRAKQKAKQEAGKKGGEAKANGVANA